MRSHKQTKKRNLGRLPQTSTRTCSTQAWKHRAANSGLKTREERTIPDAFASRPEKRHTLCLCLLVAAVVATVATVATAAVTAAPVAAAPAAAAAAACCYRGCR